LLDLKIGAPTLVAHQLTALSSVPPTLVVTLGKVVFIAHVMALNLTWQVVSIPAFLHQLI
jgi:hypothetical protein